ncbi:hypothetical protein C8Q69DRAFT_210526 [Paecilomyces variotii]|uniref:Uncharacterized protein n=1 Tax=Byssochlamys spectabilis TaxID=264951 RepID=A0A443HYL6_BYSSP|nr:hypothetical protein C8Q69DRAFT_210526 [Paecilomyces variotii]RWQ96947.1 hypothetical protein C8Q69DRAFT_210526 [Paecilomyces variotii]
MKWIIEVYLSHILSVLSCNCRIFFLFLIYYFLFFWDGQQSETQSTHSSGNILPCLDSKRGQGGRVWAPVNTIFIVSYFLQVEAYQTSMLFLSSWGNRRLTRNSAGDPPFKTSAPRVKVKQICGSSSQSQYPDSGKRRYSWQLAGDGSSAPTKHVTGANLSFSLDQIRSRQPGEEFYECSRD